MTKLRIALEWFLNPDHLPLLAARELWQADGRNIELVIPDDHYDGFDALADGAVDLVVNEPLHLVEQRDLKLTSHGCFFATDGGVLMHRDALLRLTAGAPIRIASPVSNPTTDGLCLDILRGWMASQGALLEGDQVRIDTAGFSHVDNLANGFDGAWLAFANVEGVSAQVRGMDTQMITTAEAGIPNFSALELIGAADATAGLRRTVANLVATLDKVTPGLCADPAAARALWYRASGAAPDAESDAIVDASLSRFLEPVVRDAEMWRPMWRYLHDRGGDVVDEATFEAMFA
ncbi:MAG: ABC transporter substrate-binding protein [Sphingomonadales bacterium]|nr:ABC transporter substrate-binding protein [Sphingomonadales bacterium]NCQ20697.1 ABC transporter substrate-binding protein [Sphingomonadales bacterium]NCT03695.1 ABC transporter substrate-binding protein [Sphingomonadales bacterium]